MAVSYTHLGDEDGSWKRAFQDAGYDVECVLTGLGELEAIQQLFAAHAQVAMDLSLIHI